MRKRLSVIKQSKTGLNQTFRDNKTRQTLTRGQVNKKIISGEIKGYHVAKINGHNVPRSNPDKLSSNNLG